MDYKVVVTRDAEEDLERFIKYLIFEKKSLQAAEHVLDDYDATIHFFNTWFRVLQPIDEMQRWIDELKNQGYHLYILSNAPVIFEEYVTNYSFVKLFDGSVFSGSIKIAKPDTKIYQYLMDKYQLNKEECLFIDDKLENVEASREFGMDAIVYHNNLEEIINIVIGSN